MITRLEGINKFDTCPELADISAWHLNMRDPHHLINFFDTFPFLKEVRDSVRDGLVSEDEHVESVAETFRTLDQDQLEAFFGLESPRSMDITQSPDVLAVARHIWPC